MIGNDAALTARIFKVVNSPLLRTNKEITDLQMAIGRLGINYTCNLATGLAMEQMFQATSDVIDRTPGCWRLFFVCMAFPKASGRPSAHIFRGLLLFG